MTTHELTRTARSAGNLPVCTCGYYQPRMLVNMDLVGRERAVTQARTAVLNHIDQVRDLPQRQPSPSDPFDVGAERAYPRAGVRQLPTGRWRLTLWDGPGIMHAMSEDEADHPDRYSAFGYGWLIIRAHRITGTRLNGMAA